MPIQLQSFSCRIPAPLPFHRKAQTGRVSSYRLTPGMESAKLSFKQKKQKLFHSSKVPGLSFIVQADCPDIMNLAGLCSVPFRVRLLPKCQRTSKILQDTSQTALIIPLKLVLTADTYVIAQGYKFTGPYESGHSFKHKINLPLALFQSAGSTVAPKLSSKPTGSNVTQAAPSSNPASNSTTGVRDQSLPVYQKMDHPPMSHEEVTFPGYGKVVSQNPSEDVAGPSSAREVTRSAPRTLREQLLLNMCWDQDNSESVDVGAVLNLRIGREYVTVMGQIIPNAIVHPIYPSFTTFCIIHTHRLKWKLGLLIAGESVKYGWETPVSVVDST